MPKKIPLSAVVADLPSSVPFVGPETQERTRGSTFKARLGANESVFGPSPVAIAAMADAARDVWMYADPESYELKIALAAHYAIAPESIIVGEGIDGLLGYLCRMFVEPGVKVVTSDGAYPTFNYHVTGCGGTLVKQPYKNDAEDIDALLAASEDARLVYLANPDNPMGTMHSSKAVVELAAGLPDGCLLVLDEAYGEFAELPLLPLNETPENVIRFRTFSKAYGMAGARVGYGIGSPQVIDAFNKIRNHFGMSRISIAGALAALNDQAYLEKVKADVSAAKARIAELGRLNGLTPLESHTNFVALDCRQDGDFARSVLAELGKLGVFVRMPFVAPQDRCIRISAGRPRDLDVLEDALPKALAAARSD